MGKSCTVKPHIQGEDGKLIESTLFNDLLHYSNGDREFAKKYYGMATDPEFLEKFGGQLFYDQNGEVTFKSLKKLLKFDINTERLLDTLNRDLGAGVYDYDVAMDRLQQFNLNSQYNDDFLATIEREGSKYRLSVVEKNSANEDKLYKVISNRNLWDRIIFQLKQNGVGVEFLEGTREGKYSTENAEQMADGLYSLIKLSKGERQTEILAEEAGHFAVGALGNNPLVDRLITNLTPEIQKELLGDVYDEKQLGVDSRREVAGMLVGKALMNQVDRKTNLANLLDRVVNLVKKTFAKFREDDVMLAKMAAQEAAEEIAKGFMSKDFEGSVEEALKTQETLYSAESRIETQVFKKAVNDIYQLAKELNLIESGLSEVMLDKLKNLERYQVISGAFNDNHPTGIFTDMASVEGLILTTQELLEMFVNDIPSRLEEINFSNSRNFGDALRDNGQKIRELRMFMQHAGEIVKLLRDGLAGSQSEFEAIKNVEGLYVTNPETGQAELLPSLKEVSTKLEESVTFYAGKVLEQERNFFLRFLKEVYGDNYVRRADMRMYKPGTIFKSETKAGFTEATAAQFSLESYLNALDEDISIFDAFIGAMSNSSDVISQIVDKAVKIYNREADRRTNETWDRLKVLKRRFEFLQKAEIISDTDAFYERFDDGKLTGNFRTEHKWGDYERDYRKFRVELERDFHIQHALELKLKQGKRKQPVTITKDEYNNLSEEEKQNVIITKSDLDSRSLIYKDIMWDIFSKDKINHWKRVHSVFDQDRHMYVPNSSYDDRGYQEWADRGCTLFIDSQGKYYTRKEAQKLTEEEQNNLTREDLTVGSLMAEFMQLKDELDNAVDGHMPYYRAPQVKAYFGVQMANRVNQDYLDKKFKRPRAFGKTLRRTVTDAFCEDSDDFDYGSAVTYNTIDDDLFRDKLFYEKEKLNRIPMFFINKLRDTAEMSTDIFHSMLSYASMANSYWACAEIVHVAEIGGGLLAKRKVAVGNNPKLKEDIMGKGTPAKWQEGGLAYRRYLKYLDRQLYGIGLKKLMITKRICLTKILGLTSKTAATTYLGGNIYGGLVNIGTGFNEMFKEACVGQFYTLSNFANAHKQYWSSGISNWANIGNLTKEDKVSLMIRHFDILGDERGKQRGWYTKRDRFFGNFLFGESLMLPYSSGERYMQCVTYLSLLDAIQLYDINGKKVKVFDAYKVVELEGGVKTLQLLNGSEKSDQASQELKVLIDLLNFSNKVVTGEISMSSFVHRIHNLTETEKQVLYDRVKHTVKTRTASGVEERTVGLEPSMIGNPMEFSNQLSEALETSQLFFKEEDGKAKYDKLLETYAKLQSIIEHGGSDASSFTEEELNMFRSHKVYDLIFKKDEEDGSLILDTGNPDIIDDAKQAVKDEIEKLTWGRADEALFVDRAREISDRLHGIYNRMDKTWAHQTIVGNMALVMRGYALGMMQRRFGTAKYNVALGTDVEGSYNTLNKMLWASATDKGLFKYTAAMLLWGSFIGLVKKDNKQKMIDNLKQYGFNETQFYNMRRNHQDLLIIAALQALLKILLAAKKDGDDDDDDEEDVNPIVGSAYYLASRLHREQTAFNFPGAFIEEASQYFKPTVPGVSVVLDMCEMAEAIGGTTRFEYFDGMTTNDPGGKYYYHQRNPKLGIEAGDKKWEKKLARMTPYYKSVLVWRSPYEAASAFDYGRRTISH